MNSIRNQSGAALVVGLIFLVILTLLGITAMQTGILEERMAGNSRDRNIAFQAAEAALRDGEHDTQCVKGDPVANPPRVIGCIASMTGADELCTDGLCCKAGTSGLACVEPAAPGFYTMLPTILHPYTSGGKTFNVGSVPYGHFTGATALPVPTQPNYIIEPYRSSQGSNYYRISALGYGQNSSTTVTLQEVYKE